MVPKEIIVKVGCEGGSLSVEGKRHADGGWRFRAVRNEMALYDLCVEDGEQPDPAGFFEKSEYVDLLG